MAALQRLRQLHRVADQHDVPGRPGHGEDVSDRDLAGLVHDEVVERRGIVPRKVPRGGADHVGSSDFGCIVLVHEHDAWVRIIVAIVGRLLNDATVHAFRAGPVRDLLEEVADRFVAIGQTAMRLPARTRSTIESALT